MVHQAATQQSVESLTSDECMENIYQFQSFSLETVNSNLAHLHDIPRRQSINDQVFVDEQSLTQENTDCPMMSQTHFVVILGELSVGKSALCRKFFHTGLTDHNGHDCDDSSSDAVIDKVVDENAKSHHIYERPVQMKQQTCQLRILDINTEKHLLESSGDELYSNLGSFVESSEACIVTYAVTDKGTFKTADEILTKLFNDSELHMRSKPVILAGNKCDLVRKRQVTTNDGAKLAGRFNVKFIETSATLNQNVSQLFEGVINQIHLREAQSSRRSSGVTKIKNRPTLIKRFSHNLFNPFGTKKIDKNEELGEPDNQSTSSTSSDTSSTRSSKVKGRGFWNTRKNKSSDSIDLCQDLSVI